MTPLDKAHDVKVLLADADLATATMYQIGLEQSGLQVESVHNASDLFEIVGGGERVIVMEWEDLGLTGPQVLGHLKQTSAARNVPVLVLTNLDGDVKRLSRLATEAGAQRWLVKANTTPAELAENVLDVLGRAA